MEKIRFSEPKEQKALQIIRTLNDKGFAAYFVGGYVRDKLLGRPMKDIDIATNARPEQVMRIFKETRPTGLQHGTVTVLVEKEAFEVTTFRRESDYERYRRPREVVFVLEIKEDLQRRDFTINAMALDSNGQLIDPFGGYSDLREGRLRTVGSADERYHEDALRMLRCIRFAAEYGLQIDSQSWSALIRHRNLLRHIAMERVGQELEKMMNGSAPARALRLLAKSGLLAHTKEPLPGIGKDSGDDFKEMPFFCLEGMEKLPLGPERWAAVFIVFKVPLELPGLWMRRLKLSVKLSEAVERIMALDHHLAPAFSFHPQGKEKEPLKTVWKKAAAKYGKTVLAQWLAVRSFMDKPSCPSENAGEGLALMLERGSQWLREIPVEHIRDLKIDGTILQKVFDRPPGPWLGVLLNRLYLEVVLGNIPNEQPELIAAAKSFFEKE